MRFSFPTLCIIFGVTLVHLFLITALSPLDGEVLLKNPVALEISNVDPPAEVINEPLEPIDLPAQTRESETLSAPVAETGNLPADLPALHPLAPLPQS